MKLTTKLTIEEKSQLKRMVFAGRLASMDELSLTMIESPIAISEYEHKVTFYIKCLSPIPKEIESHFEYENKIFTGNTNSFYNTRILEQHDIYIEQEHDLDLRYKVRKLLENKLILFQLDPKDEFVYVDIKEIEATLPKESYQLLPSPKLKLSETKADLEKKLVQDRRPIGLDYYPSMLQPEPALIIYDDSIYRVDIVSKSNPTTYFQHENSAVTYLTLTQEEKEYFLDVMFDEYLYFVETDKYEELVEMVENKGITLQVDSLEEVATVEREKETPSITFHDQHQRTDKSEIDFIQTWKQTIQNDYLMFHTDDTLINFHLSVKTNPITLLGGMSGTGKTQLARAYAEALRLPKENRLFIPITPSYQEPGDMFGYLNPQTGIYHESEAGLVSLLLRAEEHPDELFMVIFDEMNLSQVEHWFSPFLSLLELKEERYLSLFNEDSHIVNGKYKPKVKLHDNVIFIGTVNFDETTKDFSDRLLDRINMIIPEKVGLKDAFHFYQEQTTFNETTTKKRITRDDLRDAWIYQKDIDIHLFSEEEIYLLDEIDRLIQEQDPQKGVSFRTALAIAEYIVNIPYQDGEPIIDRKRAIDMQINQRVLTKIKGMETFVEELVGYYHEGNQYVGGTLTELFESEIASNVSSFEVSIQTLKNKAKELKIYGYTN